MDKIPFQDAADFADQAYWFVWLATVQIKKPLQECPMNPLISARAPYSAIVDRPSLKLPGNGRMLVWLIVNVEHWSIERAMPRTVLSPPMGQPLLPDVPNWAWHEYGMRVGFWRIYDALNQRGIVPTMATNGIVCESYPRIVESALKKDWEIMGHGFVQGPMHKLENQQEAIQQKMHPTLGKSAASDSKSSPAPKRVI
jgi:hypothetical protein